MDMSEKELRDLVISAAALAFAFAILFLGGIDAFTENSLVEFVSVFVMSLIGVSLGFILHELGHRYVARRFDCFAEFTVWPLGLLLAIVSSFFGLIFAAPGAVMIYPKTDMWGTSYLSPRKLGLISISGPAMNVALSIVFLFLYFQLPWAVFQLGAWINAWLAAFNLIPFALLDGLKIFRWDKRIWGISVAVVLSLMAFQVLFVD